MFKQLEGRNEEKKERKERKTFEAGVSSESEAESCARRFFLKKGVFR